MNFPPKHVLIITSNNLACNPRCLKEVQLFYGMNVKVTVVAFELHNWTTQKERELNRELNQVDFHYIESSRANFFPWLFSTMLEKTSRILTRRFPSSIRIASFAIGKRSWLLNKWAKNWNGTPDLVIAHNPPAFYTAALLAKKKNIPFALDIEDYHPGEGHDRTSQLATTLLMREFIGKTCYTSFASPLIKEYSLRQTGLGDFRNAIVINNIFPEGEFREPAAARTGNKIQLIWFSQFIGYGRGLEQLLPVLDQFAGQFELTLVGSQRASFFDRELVHRKYVQCLPSLSQKELHLSLNKYDIGLAIEDRDADTNKNICISNKIWSYFQAGLYILASDTDGQKSFLEEFPAHGICVPLSSGILYKTFEGLSGNIDKIRAGRGRRFRDATGINWENEAKKILAVLSNG